MICWGNQVRAPWCFWGWPWQCRGRRCDVIGLWAGAAEGGGGGRSWVLGAHTRVQEQAVVMALKIEGSNSIPRYQECRRFGDMCRWPRIARC